MRKTAARVTVAIVSELADSYDCGDRAVQLSFDRPIRRGNILDDDLGIGGYMIRGPRYMPCHLSVDGV
jgi:hypothetical protein